jgi:CRP/FNR family transcriptional regulator, cyclic AMP receptor protein
VYFVVEGRVRVVNHSMAGREVTFDEIAAGGHFGELAAIDGDPRSATVVALEPTQVAVMPASVFAELVSQEAGFALRVMRDLTRLVRAATERIMDLSTLGAHNRVYAEILRLARPNERGDNTAVLRPIPTHGEIASRVSTTRETVARVFGELTRMHVLKREQDAIVVGDVARLAEMVELFKDT